MDAPMEKMQRASLSDALAAERTYLAWIRTGLALLGLGFVVARFGLFLERLDYIQHITPAHSYGLSLWFGTGLILAGGGCVSFVGVALCAADPSIEPGRSVGYAAIDSGGAGRCVFGAGGTGDGDLSGFRARFAVAERITGLPARRGCCRRAGALRRFRLRRDSSIR
jgi:hypothetical protein